MGPNELIFLKMFSNRNRTFLAVHLHCTYMYVAKSSPTQACWNLQRS